LEVVDAEAEPVFASLAGQVRESLRQEALRFYRKRKTGQVISDSDEAVLRGLSLTVAEEWRLGGDPTTSVENAIRTIREFEFLAANADKAPRGYHEVRSRLAQDLAGANAALAPSMERLSLPLLKRLENAWPHDLPGREAVLKSLERAPQTFPEGDYEAANSREEKARLLDSVCSSNSPASFPVLREMTAESWARDRALLNLTLRFGQPNLVKWDDWLEWIYNQERRWKEEEEALGKLIEHQPVGLLLVLYSQLPEAEPATVEALLKIVYDSSAPVEARAVIQSWARFIPMSEQRALLGLPEARPPPLPPPIPGRGRATAGAEAAFRPPPLPVAAEALVQTGETPAPLVSRGPSVWEKHIQPLFVENWYIVAGIAMVILGSSLLAYYTWDKHWLVRYTIMPSLLALFTWSLAGAGRWIEKKGNEFTSTAAILRAAAIGLLPINFMTMALLSADEQVPQKGTALLVMGLIYLLMFGWGLRKWCAAVEPALRNWLAGPLLLLNSLVAVGPLARALGHLEGRPLLASLGAGFYLGFLITALTIVHFTRRILTREMAEEKRVPWFVAGALAITFLQVFVWVHGFMRHLPHAHTYALLVIGTGWLVLFAERRALQLRAAALSSSPDEGDRAGASEVSSSHGGESFLGFALILLGLLMGFNEPLIRIACFVGAGGAWMYQAILRRHPLHYWIALTLWGLAVASVGLLPQFPGPWLPLLGVAAALGFGAAARIAPTADSRTERGLSSPQQGEERGGAEFSGAAEGSGVAADWKVRAPIRTADTATIYLTPAGRGMQVVALFLTAIIAPLVQWHYQSEPLATAGWLAIVAGLFAWRAFNDHKARWLHATMAVLALVLPYVGFVDLAGRTAHHNTMVFGLALLSLVWLGVCRVAQSNRRTEGEPASAASLVLDARSTVLWFYGVLALTAMVLRVMLGDTAPAPLWYRDYMDYTGPILIMLALIPATFYSRSLIPAAMAVAVMTILFPELKANLQQSLPWLSWGSGLASAICGLGLVWLCFFLRSWGFLKNLGEGDRFLGSEQFPVRRYDHTLFTWPILMAVVFLIAKVDSWNVVRNELAGGIGLKTAIAVGLTGIAWTFLGVYHREHPGARVGVHLGWICALAGISFGYWRKAAEPHWTWPLLMTGLLLQGLYWLYRFRLQATYPWVTVFLAEPTRKVLQTGSGALAVISILCLLGGTGLDQMQWLCWFLAAQLVWHGLRKGNQIFGAILFFQVWVALLAATVPGSAPLWERLSVENGLTQTLWLLLAIQFIFQGRLSNIQERLKPLLWPSFLIASGLAVLLGLAGILDGIHWQALSVTQQGLLLLTLLLTARAQASALIALFGMLLAYVMVHRGLLMAQGNLEAQIELLVSPWRLALLGLSMVLLAQGGRLMQQRKPELLTGPFPQPFFAAPQSGWIYWPAAIFSTVAAVCQTFDPLLRESAAQLAAPYVGAVTFALLAYFWKTNGFFAGAGALLLLGNIHFVRVFGGDAMRDRGLSELHLLCLGIGLTLLEASLLRRSVRAPKAVGMTNLVSIGLAFSILLLLSANYFTEPNLATMSSTRFVISGALAWLAGWYFRRAARQPGPGEEAHVDLCEALYHFGLVLAIWCAALLVPWFRQPLFTLIALGLPVLWFYSRAELGIRAGRAEARRYRNSAAILGFILLGLYVFKGIFHVVLFPGTPISTQYYHYNAPVIFVLGIVLLRLHGLGGTSWLAFYGGLALMTGSYFGLTALPGFSPFDDPIPAAWCALGLGHFWILLSYARSPVRTLIQQIGNLDDLAWHSLRHSWGLCLLVAAQGATLWGIADYSSNTWLVAPLLAGAATILIHQGFVRLAAALPSPDASTFGRFPTSTFFFVVAAIELTMALHMDFLIPSYLAKEHVIWAILGIWLLLLAAAQLLRDKLPSETIGLPAFALGALVLAHVFYHRPWSNAGLWGVALGALLAAWNPQRNRQTGNAMEKFCAALLLGVPAWLVYFSQAPFDERGLEAGLEAWPILAATGVIFLTGLFCRLFPLYLAAGYDALARSRFRLFDLTLNLVRAASTGIYQGTLWVSLLAVGIVQIAHYQDPFAAREIALLTLTEAGLVVAWYFEGKRRESRLAYYLMQIAAVACFASARRQLMLTTVFWNYEYDVWASLAVSFGLAGAKQVSDLQPRALRVPLLTAMLLLPALALVWVLVHGLGVNLALVVVGLHSVMFAYLGKDNRESPYNILALSGFVAFILVTFYSKLQFRAIHAYIIPVGLGVLVLQELFRSRTSPEARNWIRLVTLMAMLGSAAYYALTDDRHAITFNLTLILLALLAMGLGSFLRLRLYLAMGFAGLMVDLISILYKVLVHMERSARMTIIGIFVLAIGAFLVFGAIYYKTNKTAFDTWLNRWRGKLAQWE